MSDSNVEAFIEAILADRPPGSFGATATDAELVRVAITLRAGRTKLPVPDEKFVKELQRRLAATVNQNHATPSFPPSTPRAGSPTGLMPSRDLASRRERITRRRFAVVGRAAAAAAILLAAATFAASRTLDRHSPASLVQKPPSSGTLRSGELLAADGRRLGWMYTYGGNSPWVFMSVRASGLGGVYMCQLQLVNGTTVPVGTMTVHDGSGEFARIVRVDVGQLRAARLVSPTGSTLASATFS